MSETKNTPSVHSSLGVEPGSIAEYSHLQDADLMQKIRAELDAHHPDVKKDAVEDFSAIQNGSILLGGRYVASDNRAFYWMVRDNRLYVTPSFTHLRREEDKMQCLNQALVAFAGRSTKPDLKSAAIAVSERGYFYIAHNTTETIPWNKECAEVNLGTIVKQLGKPDDKIRRVYVLGGLTDEFKPGHIRDQLIGMCMRCVSSLLGLMSDDATVTIVPANDGKANIGLRETPHMNQVKAYEAWQVPYSVLVEPSIIRFDETVKAAEAETFKNMMAATDVPAPPMLLESDTPLNVRNIHHFMMAHMKSEMAYGRGGVDSLAMAVLEIQQGGRFHYEFSFEPVGHHYNAMVAPVSRAASIARPIPKTDADAHISRIFFTGYNADGSDYMCNPEQWDRAIKRTLPGKSPPVEFIPLNDGEYLPDESIIKPLDALVPTRYRGSKQPDSLNVTCC